MYHDKGSIFSSPKLNLEKQVRFQMRLTYCVGQGLLTGIIWLIPSDVTSGPLSSKRDLSVGVK